MKKCFVIICMGILLTACGGQQTKSFSSELTSSDSVTIKMGQWNLIKFHSKKLGIDINYPSFLYYQELPSETAQEVFMADDVSISVMADSMRGIGYSAGQRMMGMGADLVDVGDNYSIHTGVDEEWEYYGKVIDDDSVRIVTVMLRYYPEHAEAMEPLREWVDNYKIK